MRQGARCNTQHRAVDEEQGVDCKHSGDRPSHASLSHGAVLFNNVRYEVKSSSCVGEWMWKRPIRAGATHPSTGRRTQKRLHRLAAPPTNSHRQAWCMICGAPHLRNRESFSMHAPFRRLPSAAWMHDDVPMPPPGPSIAGAQRPPYVCTPMNISYACSYEHVRARA